MATTITIANIKGGIGKSTTALNLADQLMLRGKRVLMIDTDPQRNTTKVYGAQVENTATLYDILFSNYKGEECIQHTEYGDIIASDSILKNADTEMKPSPKMYKWLQKALKNVQDEYDYIIIDTPPRSGVLLGNALEASDYMICPVVCDAFGIQGLSDIYDIFQEYQEDNDSLKLLGLLKVKYKSNQRLTASINDSTLPGYAEAMQTKIFETVIRESVKCQEAQTMQRRLSDYAPGCTTAEDYSNLVDEILKEVE